MKQGNKLTVIGRVERVLLVDHGQKLIPAKVDTGADISSIWATQIKEEDNKLTFVLFGKRSRFYTGERVTLGHRDFELTRIANSFGDREMRYVVKLSLKLGDRVVRTNFTLANRSRKTYPILLGRSFLYKKFLVDVSRGEPLLKIELAKKRNLRATLKQTQQ